MRTTLIIVGALLPTISSAQIVITNGADIDMDGSIGSQIIFPDGTVMGSAAAAVVPTGHGGTGNTVSGQGAFVGGGKTSTAFGDYSAVVGGASNTANGDHAFVGGGEYNSVQSDYTAIVGGVTNQIGDASNFAVIGGGRDNVARGFYTSVAGGYKNHAYDEANTIGGGRNNIAGSNDGSAVSDPYATVGGGFNNFASADNSTIGGGNSNRAQAPYATVGGGYGNTASGNFSTVAGGADNSAVAHAAVGGGEDNVAGGLTSVIGGGALNTTSGTWSVIGGGTSNEAAGILATVPGGQFNQATGNYSFAAGRRAQAFHSGAFVWADSTNTNFRSTAHNQFAVRASGGVWFGTTSTPTTTAGRFIETSTGAYLSSGGAWTNASDADRKHRFTDVDASAILQRIAELPIREWSYIDEPKTRHIGPTAQDFYKHFGLGGDEKSIATVDADGVALAAIQALVGVIETKQQQIEDLEQRVAAIEQRRD